MQADLEVIRRIAPNRAEAMMLVYEAYIKAGFDHDTARQFVSDEFLLVE